jgi:antitoxin component YwqK of YwqJK toxin-antitoxin module
MEKLLVICCILISSGNFASAQGNVYELSDADSIVRPSDPTINSKAPEGQDNTISISGIPNFPDKRISDKKISSRTGLYVSLNASSDTQFVGNFRKGRLNGEWMSWFNNRKVCDSGLLIDNLPDGTWKGWYANGHPRYILQFSARKLISLKNELLKQPKTKYFILASKTPEEASRHYDAQLLFGHKTSGTNNTLLSKKVNHPVYSLETLKNIVAENADGRNSSAYKAPFSEGLLHGQFTSFYANGAIKETGLYLNGLREGMWEEFSLLQEKAVGTYRHGYRNGEWRYYNPQGKLLYWKRFDVKGKETDKYSFATNKPNR